MIYETKSGSMIDFNDVAEMRFINPTNSDGYLGFYMMDTSWIKCTGSTIEDFHMALAFENTYGGSMQMLFNNRAVNVDNLSGYTFHSRNNQDNTNKIYLKFNGTLDDVIVQQIPNDLLFELDARLRKTRGQDDDLQSKFEKKNEKAIKRRVKKLAA